MQRGETDKLGKRSFSLEGFCSSRPVIPVYGVGECFNLCIVPYDTLAPKARSASPSLALSSEGVRSPNYCLVDKVSLFAGRTCLERRLVLCRSGRGVYVGVSE